MCRCARRGRASGEVLRKSVAERSDEREGAICRLFGGFVGVEGLVESADDRAADDDAVRDGGDGSGLLGIGDAEPDTDGFSGICAQIGDVLGEVRWKGGSFTGDAGERLVVDEGV